MEENKNIEPKVVSAVPEKDIKAGENLAITSFVLGLISLFSCWIILGAILGIFAIKLGGQSRKILRASNKKYFFGLLGEIAGWVSVVVAVFIIILFIVVFAIIYEIAKNNPDFVLG